MNQQSVYLLDYEFE
ncbi:unnamed protein product, partial [Rotaria sordida]